MLEKTDAEYFWAIENLAHQLHNVHAFTFVSKEKASYDIQHPFVIFSIKQKCEIKNV